jgi:5-formyltetrahydrofolate cyclo-ligase
MMDQSWAHAQSLFTQQALSKAEVRALFKNWSPSFPVVQNLNLALQNFLKLQTGVWAAFVALGNEVSVETSIQASPHLQWAFPRVFGDRLRFFVPGSHGFEHGAFGLQEPVVMGAREVDLPEMAGVLVPGMAFDVTGTRLGRGKGFYDRNLNSFIKPKVGIAAHEQVFQKLPREGHDLRVEHLVTDRGILHF